VHQGDRGRQERIVMFHHKYDADNLCCCGDVEQWTLAKV
jgi:hypothetical protein